MDEQAIKNRIGYVAQEAVYYGNKTVQWHARFAAAYFADWDGARFYQLLDEFRVNRLKQVRHLSGGQKKLLSLAFALSHGAGLLILDEPAAGLDAVHRRALVERLRAFVADGSRAVIVASHNTDALDEIADEVLFLLEGRVVLRDNKDDLLSRWKWIHYREGALAAAAAEQLRSVSRQPFASRGLTSDFPALREALATPIAAGNAKVENARLEDVLVSLVKEV